MFDIGIIGAGPAGYAAAIRASQKGLKVVLFEKDLIGGTCLNRGCIPTKTILHSCKIFQDISNASKYGVEAENISFNFEKIQERQKTVSEKIRKSLTNLIKNYGITVVEAKAEIEDKNIIKANNESYEVKNIVIAAGSKPNRIKFNGNYNDNYVLTSDDILNMTTLPQSIAIVGSGAIGIEWARIFSALKVKVYIIELMDKLLPSSDNEVSERISRIFKRNRIEFYTSTTIEEIQGNKIKLSNSKEIEAENILLGAGRRIETNFGSMSKELKIERRVSVDSNFKTNIDNIYAIGDVNGISMLAHSAMKQAEELIDYIIYKKEPKFNMETVPAVIYGSPEIAWIGKTEQELIKENINYKKSFFPVAALGKAYADDNIEGFIKILSNKDKILGAHIISEEASSLIHQIAIVMSNNLSVETIHNTIFAHPTYSEGIYESILALDNMAIHIPQLNKG